MIRRKTLIAYPHPDYCGKDYWYTLNLKHGGIVANDMSKLGYIGGTVSKFDFFDSRMLSWRKYIDSLCEQLGYLGSKNLYGMDEGSNTLKKIECELDIYNVILTGSESREFTIYLEAEKTINHDDGEEIEGSVVYIDEELEESNEEVGEKRVCGLWLVEKGQNQPMGSSNSEDEDYICVDDSGDEVLDRVMFKENIDADVEWLGSKKQNDGDSSKSSESGNESCDMNESDFDSVASEESEEHGCSNGSGDNRIVFRASTSQNPTFLLEQIFSTKLLFKDAVNSYSVNIGRPTKFTKNDARRIYARCRKQDEGCGWHINALKLKNEESFQIRELDLTHTCARSYHVENANSRWLAQRFETSFRCDPKKTVRGFRNSAITELGVYVSPFQAYRAKHKALKLIEGSSTDQYSKLWDYAETLREKNQGSTVILQLNTIPSGREFKRFYVCLAAVKNGFRSGCRPWIGVDGCHLRGQCSGVLLTAVCMDPNNDPYPLAYAVVGAENKESWEWFLQLLKEDLVIEREDAYTFMSDKQKGLIGAFQKVMPAVENRFCVRHLHGNMKRAGFKGDAFKKLLWKAANATTMAAFNRIMSEIEVLDKRCLEWLQRDKSANEWSKSHFSTFGKCDTLVNNMCEQFNSCLLDAREKPILTMLEWIREYIMSRLQKNRDRAERKWEGRKICERTRLKIGKTMEASSTCVPIKSNEYNYEVSSFDGTRYAVDLLARTCDCRRWELSGIPCKHAISAICAEGHDPEDYVHKCYSIETYCAVYAFSVNPMNGEELWQKTGYIPPLPPVFGKKKKGRPQKERRCDANEDPKKKKSSSGLKKMAKQNFKVTCKFCGEVGHNRAGCPTRKAAEEIVADIEREEMEQTHETMSQQPEEMTQQRGYPNFTQEEEIIDTEKENTRKKPTTRQGRKMLARKKSKCVNTESSNSVRSESSTAYSIANEIHAPQPRQIGVQIRAPPPMSFHPQHFVGSHKDKEFMQVFTQGGTKFATLSSLRVGRMKGKEANK